MLTFNENLATLSRVQSPPSSENFLVSLVPLIFLIYLIIVAVLLVTTDELPFMKKINMFLKSRKNPNTDRRDDSIRNRSGQEKERR